MDYVMDSDEDSNTGSDFVSWQSSQSTCHALNQLLKSNNTDRPTISKDTSGSFKGWQRQDSFEQIPGFSRLATADNDSSPTKPASGSHKPSSSTRSYRPRHSDTKLRATSAGPDTPGPEPPPLSLPFFDKTNPSQFIDLLKGVSARLDQKAGVRPRHSLGGGSIVPGRVIKLPRKRPRVASAAGTSAELESLSSRVKKSRLECVDKGELESKISADNGKGKGKEQPEDNVTVGDTPELNLSVRRSASGVPMSSRVESQRAGSSNLNEDISPVDVAVGEISNTKATFEATRKRPPQRTVSQIKMPPPPVPITRPYGASISNGESLRPRHPVGSSPYEHLPENGARAKKDVPLPKSEPMPRLHPLLLQQQSQTKTKTSTPQTPHPVQVPCSPASASLANKLKNYTNSQKRSTPTNAASMTTPQLNPTYPIPKPNFQAKAHQPQPIALSSIPSSSQAARAPPLGMRRAHTLPSSGLGGSFNKAGPLPAKQKGFKPPLISASQPQAASQSVPQVIAAAPKVAATPTTRGPVLLSTHQTPHPQGGDMQPVLHYGSSNGSTSSNNPIRRTHSNNSSFSSSLTSCTSSTGLSASKSASSTTPAVNNIPDSPPLPEPLDGDGDSSFGDLSFDMDALEETMKLYD